MSSMEGQYGQWATSAFKRPTHKICTKRLPVSTPSFQEKEKKTLMSVHARGSIFNIYLTTYIDQVSSIQTTTYKRVLISQAFFLRFFPPSSSTLLRFLLLRNQLLAKRVGESKKREKKEEKKAIAERCVRWALFKLRASDCVIRGTFKLMLQWGAMTFNGESEFTVRWGITENDFCGDW